MAALSELSVCSYCHFINSTLPDMWMLCESYIVLLQKLLFLPFEMDILSHSHGDFLAVGSSAVSNS